MAAGALSGVFAGGINSVVTNMIFNRFRKLADEDRKEEKHRKKLEKLRAKLKLNHVLEFNQLLDLNYI